MIRKDGTSLFKDLSTFALSPIKIVIIPMDRRKQKVPILDTHKEKKKKNGSSLKIIRINKCSTKFGTHSS